MSNPRPIGVLLAGGTSSRMGAGNKHLLDVGGEPMIVHPLRKLTEAFVKDVVLVSGPNDIGKFASLLGDGSRHGCRITYRVQAEPKGLAHALMCAVDLCEGRYTYMILGDQIFQDRLDETGIVQAWLDDMPYVALVDGIEDKSRYGAVQVNNGLLHKIGEKEADPDSTHILAGIYGFPAELRNLDGGSQSLADILAVTGRVPSKRGEHEITDVLKCWNQRLQMRAAGHRAPMLNVWMPLPGDGVRFSTLHGWWVDAGTPEDLEKARSLVGDAAWVDA